MDSVVKVRRAYIPVPVQVLGWLSQRAEGPPPEENSIKIAS